MQNVSQLENGKRAKNAHWIRHVSVVLILLKFSLESLRVQITNAKLALL